ncbi:hypothetical protein DFQ29_002445, partial [Apophysomyces sp. BC1021]
KCEGQQQVTLLMEGVNKLIEQMESNRTHHEIMLPSASQVKAPGRLAKVKRKTALPKDFARASRKRLTAVTKEKSTLKAMATRMAKKVLGAKCKEVAKAPKRKAADEVIVEDGNVYNNYVTFAN